MVSRIAGTIVAPLETGTNQQRGKSHTAFFKFLEFPISIMFARVHLDQYHCETLRRVRKFPFRLRLGDISDLPFGLSESSHSFQLAGKKIPPSHGQYVRAMRGAACHPPFQPMVRKSM